MFVSMLRAKLHQARVTDTNLHYVDSITIDTALLRQAGMFLYEKVLVVNINNGARFETYIIQWQPNSGEIQINGAAARLVNISDHLIIMAFTLTAFPPPEGWVPRILVLDENNKVESIEQKGVFQDASGN